MAPPVRFTPSAAMAAQDNNIYTVNKRFSQPLYDRANIPSTLPTTAVALFAIPRGQQATISRGSTATTYAKTTRDTNLDVAGQSPMKAFLIVGISIDFIPLSPTAAAAPSPYLMQDIQTLKSGSWFRWTKIDDLVLEMPCLGIPAMSPFTSTSLNASFTGGVNSQGGVPMYKLPTPVLLPPSTNFNVNWFFDPPSSAIALNATFDLLWTFHCILEKAG